MSRNQLTGYPSIDKPWLKYYTEEAINTPLPECTIYEYIWNCNKQRLDKSALNYFGRSITYGTMFTHIEYAAKAFSAIGVCQNELVSLCMLTMPETTYCIYALNKLGAISNLIEPRTNAELIKDRINAAHSKVLVVVDVFLPKILQIVNETALEQIVVVPLSESMPMHIKMGFSLTKGRKIPDIPHHQKFCYWRSFIENGKDSGYVCTQYRKDSPVAIIYTGGTTGISKGAVLSNDSLTTMAIQSIFDTPRLYEGKRFLGIMPPFIAYGLVFGQFIPFCTGLESVLIPAFNPKKFDDLVLKYKPNHVFGVPSFFEHLANSKKLKNKKLEFLLCAITGGDRLLEGTEEHINQFLSEHDCKHKIMKGYGMTEMGSAVTITTLEENNLPGCVGVPGHCVNIKIIDPTSGEELAYRQQGEICLSGQTMMLGYYNNDIETKKVMHQHLDGRIWVHSGDIGYVTEDGIVFVVDRMKRMIIRPDGHNVWPSVMESVAVGHSAVEECAVIGLPNPEGENGRIPTAIIVLKEGIAQTKVLTESIDQYMKKHLPERDVPMVYRYVEKLPVTLVGKVDYRALEKDFEKE